MRSVLGRLAQWNRALSHRVCYQVSDFLIDLALPRTDGEVFIQWIVMSVFWLVTIVITRKWSRDVRLFIYGIAMMNLAWFALRAVH